MRFVIERAQRWQPFHHRADPFDAHPLEQAGEQCSSLAVPDLGESSLECAKNLLVAAWHDTN